MKKCIYCGADIEDSAAFCVKCGEKQALRDEVVSVIKKDGFSPDGFTTEEFKLLLLSNMAGKISEIRKHTAFLYAVGVIGLILGAIAIIGTIAI